MRRTSLSSKLLLAALPLVVAIGALLTITVLADLDRIDEVEHDATLGTTWGVLLDASRAISAEQRVAIEAMLGRTTLNVTSAAGTPDADTLDRAGTDTDAALAALATELAKQDGFEQFQRNQISGALELGRQLARSWAHNPSVATAAANTPFDQYESVLRELHTIGSLLQSATGDPVAGRTLLGVSQFSDANLAAGLYTAALAAHQLDPGDPQHLINARAALNDVTNAFEQFDSTTTPQWAAVYRQSGVRSRTANPQSHVNQALNGILDAIDAEGDAASAYAAIDTADRIQRDLLAEVVQNADAEVDDITGTTRIRLTIIAGAVLVATILAWLLTRSITRRVRAVAAGANAVATEQLPALVDALRDPRGRALPEVAEVSTRGGDELAELATSFNSLQRTLHDVAEEQMSVLRRGVSDIFVTMARRNRSLVDRQLALLDEFEAEVEDADVLASYYQIDHLATRMRRNSESLLVLANAEPRRGRVGPTEVDTVVRAAIGEIEEYRRVQVGYVEGLRVRGAVVADIAHLLAELLDNATSFSPPETLVEVGGRLVDDGYLLRIVDSGVGIGEHRLEELNELLRNPPIVGLSVEPTLGISVVSLLAHKHGIEVTLTPSAPGVTVDVVLPTTVFADSEQFPKPAGLDAIAGALSADAVAARAGTVDEAQLIAALEADFNQMDAIASDTAPTGPVPTPSEAGGQPSDSSLTARLTDAFERADLTVAEQPPDSSNDAAAELPVRSGGLGAINALASFRAGAEAASQDLAADAAPPESPAATPVATSVESPAAPAPLLPAPSAGAAPRADLPAPIPAPAFTAAPPPLPLSPRAQPVTPADAQPAPRRAAPEPAPSLDLPTRNRAAAAAAVSASIHDESAGVAAALAAFDQAGRPAAVTGSNVGLPTRTRGAQHYTGDDPTGENPVISAVSPLGAEQLRARLRAFQTEFRTGQSTSRNEASPSHDHPPTAD